MNDKIRQIYDQEVDSNGECFSCLSAAGGYGQTYLGNRAHFFKKKVFQYSNMYNLITKNVRQN